MHYRFILENPPHPSAHASTVVESANGLMAAWFGGDYEGSADTTIWLADFREGAWDNARPLLSPDERHLFPCWNPVLHRSGERILLFYRVGPHPRTWLTRLVVSTDGGLTWQSAGSLPEGYFGPIKNKALEIKKGCLLSPSSTENPDWVAQIEHYDVDGDRWYSLTPLQDTETFGAIQPTLLAWSPQSIQALCRTQKRVVAESWSEDGGKTWSALAATELENPNSGIDGVVLADGRAALVLNPTNRARHPLQIALSDDGKRWRPGPMLEVGSGEFSYPAIIQASDGRIHVTYTYNRRRIRHVDLSPAELE